MCLHWLGSILEWRRMDKKRGGLNKPLESHYVWVNQNRILPQSSINKSSLWKSVSDLRVNTDWKIICFKNILLEDCTAKYLEFTPFKNDSTFGKCEQTSWTLLGLRDVSRAIHRQPQSCNLWIRLGWKDSDTSDSIARHREEFQQLSRYLSWTCGWWQSVTRGMAPALLPLSSQSAAGLASAQTSPCCGAPCTLGPHLHPQHLLWHCHYHLAFFMPHAQACPFAELSSEPL